MLTLKERLQLLVEGKKITSKKFKSNKYIALVGKSLVNDKNGFVWYDCLGIGDDSDWSEYIEPKYKVGEMVCVDLSGLNTYCKIIYVEVLSDKIMYSLKFAENGAHYVFEEGRILPCSN